MCPKILAFLIMSLVALTPNTTSHAQPPALQVGIFLPGSDNDITILKNFEEKLDVKFYSSKWYLDWSDNFTPNIAQRFSDYGVLPELTWQPQISSTGVVTAEVIAGIYDDYLTRFANDIKTFGKPIRITLAPEANSEWVPWGTNSNTNEQHKQFWRYVVAKFRGQQVTNVQWVWSPNVHFWGEKYSYADLYPGNDYVDYVGLDGYNWGTSQSWSSWQSFRDIFASSYEDLIKISDKNILISEMASAEVGGDKAKWIADTFASLASFPRIQGFTWFNINKETDWRIESSPASQTAFSNALKESQPLQTTVANISGSNNSPTSSGVKTQKSSSNTQWVVENPPKETSSRFTVLGFSDQTPNPSAQKQNPPSSQIDNDMPPGFSLLVYLLYLIGVGIIIGQTIKFRALRLKDCRISISHPQPAKPISLRSVDTLNFPSSP